MQILLDNIENILKLELLDHRGCNKSINKFIIGYFGSNNNNNFHAYIKLKIMLNLFKINTWTETWAEL